MLTSPIAQSQKQLPRVDRLLFLPLVLAYCFSVQFGGLFKLSLDEGAPGLSTAIALGLLLLGATKVLRSITRDHLVAMLLLLAIWLGLVGFVSSFGDKRAAILAITFLGYVLLVGAVSETPLTEKWHRRIWISIGLGLALSGGLTVLDYIKIVDVPKNNEIVIASSLGVSYVEQASGFFPRRSAMAAVFAIGIAGTMTLGLLEHRFAIRMFWLLTAAIGLVCLMLTHNRSGVLGAIISVGAYIALSRRLALTRRLRIVVLAATASVAIGFLMAYLFPDHLRVYAQKLGFLYGTGAVLESDFGRLLLFKKAVTSLAINPIGHGYARIPLEGGDDAESHNIITEIVWAGGVVGILWMIVFGALFYRRFLRKRRALNSIAHPIYVDAAFVALMSWFLHNMTHNSLNTGLAWILFGVLIGSYSLNKRPLVGRATREGKLDDQRVST